MKKCMFILLRFENFDSKKIVQEIDAEIQALRNLRNFLGPG